MRRVPDRATVVAGRDRAETGIEQAAALTLRRFLRTATAAATASLHTPALVAAGAPVEPITLGAFQTFWTAALTQGSLADRIRDAWLDGYRLHTDRTATSLDAVPAYMSVTTDRLVRGLQPPIAEDAFDRCRVLFTRSIALGWDRTTTEQRLAAELGWETRAPYWRAQLATVNDQIDHLLDPLGPPGTPARETARLHDPRVAALQADRAALVKHVDAEASHWAVRASRIARTETTSAYGAGSLHALDSEGVACKGWLATEDARTRPEHRTADGQVVPLHGMFTVGGFLAHYPGDPNLPAELIVNCRCCLIGAECV
jgi:hypothetical protein